MSTMTLDKTSLPGKTRRDELVPSRYAQRFGEIDVLVVSDGVIQISAETMAPNADPADLSAWLHDRFLPEWIEWSLNQIVVRSGGRTILIDSGLGKEAPDYPRTGRWAPRLEAAGIDLASVTDVVLTHMHFDHVGGLLVDGVKDRLRSDVRVHAASAEAEFWQSPDFSRTAMPKSMQDMIRLTARHFLDAYRSQLRTFEAEYEVAPGVLVTRTGGHTPGHSVVRLASGGERLTFVGDAVLPAGFDQPRLAQRLRARPRGGGPRPGPSFAGAGVYRRADAGHSLAVPIRLPGVGRRRRLSLGAGPVGVQTACWVKAN